MFLAETNKISIFVQPIFISYMKQIKMSKIGVFFFLICLIACKEKEKDTLPEIDFTQICQAKLKVTIK